MRRRPTKESNSREPTVPGGASLTRAIRAACTLVLVLFLVAAPGAASQESTAPESVRIEASVLLEAVVHLPPDFDDDRTYPLVVALHGFGGSTATFDFLVETFVSRGVILAALQAPYDFVQEGRLGYDWMLGHRRDRELVERATPHSIDYVKRSVDLLRSRFPVTETYMLGFSQGGRMTYLAGLGNEDLAGIVLFGAGFDETLLDDEAVDATAGQLRVYIGHGTGDQIPMSNATNARDTLRGKGYDVTFKSFGGYHEMPIPSIIDVIEWIHRPH